MVQSYFELKDILEVIKKQKNFEVRTASSRSADGTLYLEGFVAVSVSESFSDGEVSDYGECMFTRISLSSMEFAKGLLEIQDSGIVPERFVPGVGSAVRCDFFKANTSFHHQRIYSHVSWGSYPILDFPADFYRNDSSRTNRFNWHNGPANRKHLPYFRTFGQAAYHYLYQNQIPVNLNDISGFEIVIVDERGKIDGVILGETSMRVMLSGNRLDGCELKLLGTDPDVIRVLAVTDEITDDIPLPTRPQDLIVVLALDDAVLDLSHPIRRFGASRTDSGSEAEKPIEDFIAWHGESLTVEYKSQWTTKAAKTIVGFANAEGGSIFFGINDDVEGIRIVGVENIDQLKNSIQDILDKTSGHFEIRFEVHEIEQKTVLRLVVDEAQEKPVALVESGEHRFYIRRDGSTRRVRREDILKWRDEQVSLSQIRGTTPFLGR